jgi:hypothetical protein
MKSILKAQTYQDHSSRHQAQKNLSDRTMESSRALEEEPEVSCQTDSSIHVDSDREEDGGGDIVAGPTPVSPITPPVAKKRIWFGGKVTTHVQEFDRRKPACHISRFLVFRSRSSSSIPSSGHEAGFEEAPLTPTRWESGTGHRIREPAQHQGRGMRGTLMPFLPTRRRSSEETSSDDGSKGGRSGRLKEAVAYIEDPSAALRRDSLDLRRGKPAADDDSSPKMPRRRGIVVTVDSPNVLKFTTPISVGVDSPRQPVRRSSTKDEDEGNNQDSEVKAETREASLDGVDAPAVKDTKFLDSDDSTSSNVDEDDMQALERTVQTMAGPASAGPAEVKSASLAQTATMWSSRRWSLTTPPSVTTAAWSNSSPSPTPLSSAASSGRRRWSLNAPVAEGIGLSGSASKAPKSRDGKRRWTWNSTKVAS